MSETAVESIPGPGVPQADPPQGDATAADLAPINSSAPGRDAEDVLSTDPARARPRRVATDAERRALASVIRLRILRLCLYDDLTNREIAERLGRNPATVLHHVRTLVDQGFLTAGDPRRGRRGSREIPYRATGKSWTLSFDDGPQGEPAEPGDADATPDRRAALTHERTARLLIDTFLAEIESADPTRIEATRLGLRLSQEHYAEFTDRLAALFDEYARGPHDPDGQRWSVFLAMHPEGPREAS